MKIYYNEFNILDPQVIKQLKLQKEALTKRKNQVNFWDNFNLEILNKIIKIKNEKL
jgi:hypothetical protein